MQVKVGGFVRPAPVSDTTLPVSGSYVNTGDRYLYSLAASAFAAVSVHVACPHTPSSRSSSFLIHPAAGPGPAFFSAERLW
jgi:hypothetical protein